MFKSGGDFLCHFVTYEQIGKTKKLTAFCVLSDPYFIHSMFREVLNVCTHFQMERSKRGKFSKFCVIIVATLTTNCLVTTIQFFAKKNSFLIACFVLNIIQVVIDNSGCDVYKFAAVALSLRMHFLLKRRLNEKHDIADFCVIETTVLLHFVSL